MLSGSASTTVGRTKSPAELGLGLATADDGGALGAGAVEVGQHVLVLRLVGARAHLGLGLGGVALVDRLGPGHDLGDQLVADGLVHDQPRAGHAGLPVAAKTPATTPFGGRVQGGVGKTTWGDLPPQLEG